MRIIALTLIAISIFVALIVFVGVVYFINLEMDSPEFQGYIGGGAIDMDTDLAPSYAYDFAFSWNSISVAGPIILGIISLVFLVPNIVLRIKKIPTRKYMLTIAAGILIFFGLGYVPSGIQSMLTLEQLEQENDWIRLIGGLFSIGIGSIFIIPGIIVLKKAKWKIRK